VCQTHDGSRVIERATTGRRKQRGPVSPRRKARAGQQRPARPSQTGGRIKPVRHHDGILAVQLLGRREVRLQASQRSRARQCEPLPKSKRGVTHGHQAGVYLADRMRPTESDLGHLDDISTGSGQGRAHAAEATSDRPRKNSSTRQSDSSDFISIWVAFVHARVFPQLMCGTRRGTPPALRKAACRQSGTEVVAPSPPLPRVQTEAPRIGAEDAGVAAHFPRDLRHFGDGVPDAPNQDTCPNGLMLHHLPERS
jgi:hypothetical protein